MATIQNSKNLQLLDLKFFLPSSELLPFIQTYWSIKIKKDISDFIKEKIVTDGGSGIIFNFGKPLFISCNSATSDVNHNVFYTCPRMEPFDFIAVDGMEVIGVRFLPGGALPFFNENHMSCTSSEIIELFEKNISKIESLYSSMKRVENIDEQIDLLDKFFLEKLSRQTIEKYSWIQGVIDFMKEHDGNIKVIDLAKHFSLSKRHFDRRFKSEVGLSPKQFLKILRVQKARKILSNKEDNSLCEVSYDCNYFDQAHFTKEFKTFVKETPREYLHRKK